MRWLVVFWVASFLIMWALFYLFTRSADRPRRVTRARRGSTPSPYEPTPRPSV